MYRGITVQEESAQTGCSETVAVWFSTLTGVTLQGAVGGYVTVQGVVSGYVTVQGVSSGQGGWGFTPGRCPQPTSSPGKGSISHVAERSW